MLVILLPVSTLIQASLEDSPSRLSWAPEDSSPERTRSWRNWMMEKARRLLSDMMREVATSRLSETLQESGSHHIQARLAPACSRF